MSSQAKTWFLSCTHFRKWGEKLRRKHWKDCQTASAVLKHAHTDNYAHTQSPSQAGTWFRKFPHFVYDPTTGIRSNFERLATHRNWDEKSARKRWGECRAKEFDFAYGTDTKKLEIWQNLCREVHISDPPDGISQWKKLLGSRNVLVNLVNLIDHRNIGVEVIRFKTYNKFREYTCPDQIFPLGMAKKDGVISTLLRKPDR